MSIRALMSEAYTKLAPLSMQAARDRAHSQQRLAAWGCPAVNAKLVSHYGSKVLRGPWRGIELTKECLKEQAGPYLLGTYESELNPAWEQILAGSFAQILDVGAKFGFYAVGLARAFPEAEVTAFDPDPWAQDATRGMAEVNGTPNVRIESTCTPEGLRQQLRPGAFIISDCEGYENILFSNPCPAMASATLIIETHETLAPGTDRKLIRILAQTHEVTVIPSREVTLSSPVPVDFLTKDEIPLAIHEIRPAQQWLFCVPR